MLILGCGIVFSFPFQREVSAKQPLLTANLLLPAVCQHTPEATGEEFLRRTFGNSKHDSFQLV